MKTKLFLILSILLVPLVCADTGTYIIDKQTTNLLISTNGDVKLEYYIKMSVTSGGIPWMTIGLPNKNYEILDYKGAAKKVYKNDGYGWTGVKVDLDKEYKKGESFEVFVNINQKNFIKKYDNDASLEFTPVWWDNAKITFLGIYVTPPPEVGNVVKTDTQPTKFEGNKLIWEWNEVGKGNKKTIGVRMPIEAFPSLKVQSSDNVKPSTNTQSSKGQSYGLYGLIGIIILIFVIMRIFFSRRYSSPTMSVGSDEDEERKRHIIIECPNDNNRLDKKTLKDITYDFCEVCGGLFLDKGEIENLIKKEINETDLNTNKITKFSEMTKVPRICPRCEGSISSKQKTIDKETIVIYVCEDCGGLWLNKGVYQLIKSKRLEQEKEEKKKKDEDDDYHPVGWWLFYPYIMSTGSISRASFGSGSFGGGGSRISGSSGASVSSCVSCACVAACACACACAGGGAAGCSPKDKTYPQIIFNKKLMEVKQNECCKYCIISAIRNNCNWSTISDSDV